MELTEPNQAKEEKKAITDYKNGFEIHKDKFMFKGALGFYFKAECSEGPLTAYTLKVTLNDSQLTIFEKEAEHLK